MSAQREQPATLSGVALEVEAPSGAAAATMRFNQAYEQHFSFVWRNLRRLGVAAANVDDAAQEVFVVMFRRLAEVAPTDERAWLYGVARRVAADHRRTARRRTAEPLPADLCDEAKGAPDVLAVRRLHDLLDRLGEEKRDVFILAELEQMTAPEIAVAVGAPLNTVYSRLRAARSEFDQHLTRANTRGASR